MSEPITFPIHPDLIMTLRVDASWISIPSAGVSLGANGEVRIDDPSRPLEETARLFWNAVAQVRGQPLPFPPLTG
jgi:hypothetical protein